MKRKKYEKSLRKLQVRLCHLQDWVKEKGLRVVIVFEGRDGAGKGGTIRALTERLSPRVFRVVALPAPSDREKSQVYMQRYLQHFPAAGEVVIFDRSWYNRAGVEHVMGFCSDKEYKRFLDLCPQMETFLIGGGIILIKLWLEVGNDEQKKRFEARIDDPVRQWKLSPMDLPARTRWYDYSRARDRMLAKTDTRISPVVPRPLRRQEDRSPEHHRAHPLPPSIQESSAQEGQAGQSIRERVVRRREVDCPAAVGPRAALAVLVEGRVRCSSRLREDTGHNVERVGGGGCRTLRSRVDNTNAIRAR